MGVIMMGGVVMLFLGGEAKVSSKELCAWDCSKTNSSALTVLSATNLFSLTSPLPKTGQKHPGQGVSNFSSSSLHLALCYPSWHFTDPGLAANTPLVIQKAVLALLVTWKWDEGRTPSPRMTQEAHQLTPSADMPVLHFWYREWVKAQEHPKRFCSHIPHLSFPWQGEGLSGDPGKKLAVIFVKYHGVDLICPLHWGGHC